MIPLPDSEIILSGNYRWSLVLLSISVCLLSSYTSLSLMGEMRGNRGIRQGVGNLGAAVTLGGGIWSMHFISMLALNLSAPVSFQSGWTLFSLVISIVSSGSAFFLLNQLSRSRAAIPASGALLGIGITAMHYSGMAALKFDGILRYHYGIVILSGAIALGGSILAFRVMDQLSRLRARLLDPAKKLGIALILSVSAAGMHYTGMAATGFIGLKSSSGGGTGESVELLALNISILCLVILLIEIYSGGIQRKTLIRERENLFNMLDNLPVCFHLQAKDYSVPFANKMFRERFGESRKKACYDVMHHRDAPCEVCSTFRVFDTGKNVLSVWDSLDGHTYLTVCTPFQDIDGGDLVMEMAMDITDQKKAEQALILAKEEAERANQAKSQFLSQMSHELRTPLNAIMGFSQLLMMYPKDDSRYPESAHQIYSAGEHLLKLVNDMLDLSAIEAGNFAIHPEALSVGEMMEHLIMLLSPLAKAREVHLINQVKRHDRLYVLADKTRLTQALLHIVTNAVQYNRAGGSVTLQARHWNTRHIRISVADTGRGITPEAMEGIFEAFHGKPSSHLTVQNVGLGLPITRQLVELMQGHLEVESTPGKGSCFSIDLPKTDPPPA